MVAALTNFYLTTWEEFNTGTLYLSEFSGPVEGILLICGVYAITGQSTRSSSDLFVDRSKLTVPVPS